MSARFHYRLVVPNQTRTFAHGTSTDAEALNAVFHGKVSKDDIHLLRAMALVARGPSLWSDIADLLDELSDTTAIEIWPEY